jgi:serine/threonine protein kinase/lipoprotein NlpI
MIGLNEAGSELFSSAEAQREQVVARFEQAWHHGHRPSLEEYVTPDARNAPALLVELVHADLEYRLKAGERVRVERYLGQYPRLAHDTPALLELIAAEWELRRRHGDATTLEEYLQRFPQVSQELRTALQTRNGLSNLAAPVPAANPPHTGITTTPPSPAAVDFAQRQSLTEAEARPVIAGADPVAQRPDGETISGYEILGEIGRGGMGVVYKARHRALKRLVALKMILAGSYAGPNQLTRFRTEAEAAARVQHAHLVQIYEVGEQEGRPYLALEYVEGGSLDKQLNGTPMPARQAAALVETLARAIDAAHQAGIIHRDLKPANVLLTADGTPKITDFGLAKRLDESAGETASGTILGTPSYMAPEQARGQSKHIGPAADVYALGAILYELLTGRPPFKAASALDTLAQVIGDEPVAPRQLQSKTPRDLETICLKCLQKEPHKRYARASLLAEDLGRFLRGESIQARPTPAWERSLNWARRRPAVAALLVVSALAVIGAIAGGWFHARTQDQLNEALQRELDQRTSERRHRDQARAEVEDLLREADLARASGDEKKERECLTRALEKLKSGPALEEPDYQLRVKIEGRLAALALMRGRAHARLDHFEAAEEEYAQALHFLEQDPNNDARYSLYISRGVMRLRQKRFEQGLSDLEEAHGLKPERYQPSLQLANGYEQQALQLYAAGQVGALFSGLGQGVPNPLLVWQHQKNLSDALVRAAKQLDRAVEAAERLVADHKLDQTTLAALYRRRAWFHWEHHNQVAALRDIDRSIAAEPPESKSLELAKTHVLRGRLLDENGQHDQAMAAYSAALQVRPDFADAYRWRAGLWLRLQRYEAAIADCDQYLNRAEKPLAVVYRIRGMARASLGRQHLAATIEDFTTALARDPNDWLAHVQRGWAYLACNDYFLAERDFGNAIQLNPENAEAYLGRGYSRARQGRIALAAADAEEAVRRGPKTPSLLHQAACVYAQATACFDKSVDRFDRRAERTRIRYRDRAVELISAAVASLPNDAARETFWRDHIEPDKELLSLRGSVEFDRLQAKYCGAR